jgi:hypothetical protein
MIYQLVKRWWINGMVKPTPENEVTRAMMTTLMKNCVGLGYSYYSDERIDRDDYGGAYGAYTVNIGDVRFVFALMRDKKTDDYDRNAAVKSIAVWVDKILVTTMTPVEGYQRWIWIIHTPRLEEHILIAMLELDKRHSEPRRMRAVEESVEEAEYNNRKNALLWKYT